MLVGSDVSCATHWSPVVAISAYHHQGACRWPWAIAVMWPLPRKVGESAQSCERKVQCPVEMLLLFIRPEGFSGHAKHRANACLWDVFGVAGGKQDVSCWQHCAACGVGCAISTACAVPVSAVIAASHQQFMGKALLCSWGLECVWKNELKCHDFKPFHKK